MIRNSTYLYKSFQKSLLPSNSLLNARKRIHVLAGFQNNVSRQYSVLTPFQNSLLSLHDSLGGQWWSTIVIATLSFRLCLVPLTVLSRISISKLFTEKAMKYTLQLHHVYNIELRALQKKTQENKKPNLNSTLTILSKSVSLFKQRIKGQFIIWRKVKVNPYLAIAPVITQTSIFILYAMSVRDLIRQGTLDLSNEGLFWFVNLQDSDEYYILPVIAISSSYLLIDKGLRKRAKAQEQMQTPKPKSKPKPKLNLVDSLPPVDKNQKRKLSTRQIPSPQVPVFSPTQVIGNMFQYLLLFSFPITSSLPSAVFMYWIPSTAFGFSQLLITDKILNTFFRKKK